MSIHPEGLIVGAAAFVIIGLFQPVVVKTEYYFGTKPWWIFLLMGIGALAASLFITEGIVSTILAVLAFCLFWSIGELFEQRKRVARGWFPSNPKRDKQATKVDK